MPAAVWPALALGALALPPDDSVPAVPQAVAHYARAVQPAWPVQQDGSVALSLDDLPQDELAQVVPPDDSFAQREQRAARWLPAGPDEADSQVLLQADQVAQRQADSSACP